MNSEKKGKNATKTKAKSEGYLFKCDSCPKQFGNKWALITHSYAHTDETPYQCTLCNYAGKTQKYLSRHIKVSHKRDRKYECEICGKAFHFGSKLKSHMLVHTGEKPYKCGECDKAFNSSYSLNTHKLIHSNSKPYKCTFCPYACRDSSTLRKHKARHTGQIKYYTCSVCSFSCATKPYLKIHIAEKHFNIDMRRMECDYCGKRFKFRETLINHIRAIHEKSKSAKCEICGKMLSNKGNMRAHMRIHVDHKPIKCTFEGCERRFKDTSTMGKHAIRHYPERQYPCKICNKLFLRKRRMQSHLKTHMAKVKNVECDYCGVRFYNKNYLTTHIQRKHGRKKQKYVCDLCGLVTSNKPSIVMHIKYGHGSDRDLTCNICKKKFKRDVNLKLHYWTAHEMDYFIPAQHKKKCKKSEETYVEVKEEPVDHEYDGAQYFQVTPKIEPLDEEGLEELANMVPEPEIRPELEDIPTSVLEEFITPVERGRGERRQKYAKHIDKKMEKQVKKQVDSLMEEIRKKEKERDEELRKQNEERDRMLREENEERKRKMASKALERTRRKYNRLIQNAVKNSLKKDKIKIKHGAISAQEQHPDSLLEANFFIKQTIDDTDRVIDETFIDNTEKRTDNIDKSTVNNIISNEGEDECVERIDEIKNNQNEKDAEENGADSVENSEKYIDENESSANEGSSKDTRVLGRNRKLKFNTHQCYVCFKLFHTKEDLLEHCKEHFNVTNMQTLKKCPLCDYSTNLSITRHLHRKHKIKVKVPYGTFKHNKQNNKTKYYYEVNDKRIKTVEIIPSVKNLNKIESCKIDKRNKEKKNKDVLKSKLVKKGKEWIVMKEKVKINFNDCILPEFDKLESKNVKVDYIDRLKELYKMAKKNGNKMVFPCDSCDKICQTLAALKLHSRKHETNPKPFKKKVWKHKLKGKNVEKVNKKVPVINKDNRTAKPKPVVNKHKCDKKLIEFYNQNIKGGDIEFWQFLKIYNKMERENINDFEDLQKSSHFGLHCNEPVESNDVVNSNNPKENTIGNEIRSKPIKRIDNKTISKNAFTRVVRLSKREMIKRNEAREKLRQKINCNSTV